MTKSTSVFLLVRHAGTSSSRRRWSRRTGTSPSHRSRWKIRPPKRFWYARQFLLGANSTIPIMHLYIYLMSIYTTNDFCVVRHLLTLYDTNEDVSYYVSEGVVRNQNVLYDTEVICCVNTPLICFVTIYVHILIQCHHKGDSKLSDVAFCFMSRASLRYMSLLGCTDTPFTFLPVCIL
jgi:hypothetical protein